jgi:subtilase family serine protease
MYGAYKFAAPLVAVLAVAACNAGGSSNLPGSGAGNFNPLAHAMPQWQAKNLARPACAGARWGHAQCEALIESKPGNETSGYGWTPADFQARYNLPSSTKGSDQIIAIVDSYDNPDVASDLGTYRSKYGLGTAKFYKYNQEGQQKNYPEGSPGWGVEIDLDVEMVSAVCQKCTIYLVEASSESGSDMDTAEAEAVKLGAHVVSNSWICYSYSCTVDPSYFDKPGVVYLAGSGDESYGEIGPPMAFATVVAVGGTVLSQNGSGYSESVWDGAGSGCTLEIKKPKWQHDPSCSNRTDADVSAVAWDVSEFDSYSAGGWFTVGGTSVATPLLAGIYGLAGNARSQHSPKALWTLSAKKLNKRLHYISSGSNGSCGGSYLCTAGTKQFKTYAGPTGWGTPNGLSAF